MATFNVTRSWKAALDVRDYSDWLETLKTQEPNGACWVLIGPRRSGKTWALRSIDHALKAEGHASRYLNLQGKKTSAVASAAEKIVLVDEPGKALASKEGALELLETLAPEAADGVPQNKVLIAMTPGEWAALLGSGDSRANRKDARPLGVINCHQARALAGRASWAAPLLELLLGEHPTWTRSPYILELLLQVAERGQTSPPHGWAVGLADLVQEVIRAGYHSEHGYAAGVFDDGLSPSQREVLRQLAWRGAAPPADLGEMLSRCGLLQPPTDGKGWHICDPLIAAHLPPPLTVHHLSDLHFGPKSLDAVDSKEGGAHGAKLSEAAGPSTVREAYLSHLGAAAGRGRPAHAIVVSGDLAETGSLEQLTEARVWLDDAARLLRPHPRLREHDDRLLVVGGNHDVDWGAAADEADPRARHRSFAAAFAGLRPPHLARPPEARSAEVVTWPDAGIEIALLGSSELGGEVVDGSPGGDSYARRLSELLEALARQGREALLKDELSRYKAIRKQLDRIDPGLVHHLDVTRLRAHPFAHRLRIAVVHHPVSPVPAPPEVAAYASLIGAGALKDTLLAQRVQLLLHGHQHMGWLSREQWPGRHQDRALTIVSSPTLGSRESTDAQGFVELRVFYEGLVPARVELRIVRRQGTEWVESAEQLSFAL